MNKEIFFLLKGNTVIAFSKPEGTKNKKITYLSLNFVKYFDYFK